MEKEQAHISILRFPDNVRLRKGMYLSSPNQCIYEIIDNSVDEFSAGRCTNIVVAVQGDEVLVEDDGSGIPITESSDPEYKGLSEAQVAMSVLHGGGKFNTDSGYKTTTSGLHGVGASAVNAVSSSFKLIVYNGGQEYLTEFEKGIATRNTAPTDNVIDKNKTGTCTKFILDKEIWKDEYYDFVQLKKRVKQLAYLNPNLNIYLYLDTKDKDGNIIQVSEKYCFPDGVKEYVEKIIKNKIALTDTMLLNKDCDNNIKISIAFAWSDSYNTEIQSFVNNIHTVDGGDHEIGFKEGLSKAIINYALDNKLVKDSKHLSPEDVREGLVAILSISMYNPTFDGQNKHKFKSVEVRGLTRESISSYLSDLLLKDDKTAKIIIDKALKAAKARAAAKRARDAARGIKNITDVGLPGKLADCTSKNPEECELFLVEGDSAGGSAKQARDRNIQAVLPVFGKVLNVDKIAYDKVYNNVKFQDVIKALKCGIGEDFNIEKLRYHKIILLSDADSDGGHIQCLHTTFFYRYMRPIIEKGYLYAGCAPLFKATHKNNKVSYLYTEKELQEYDTTDCKINRYKGLGEQDPDELWETTLNPAKRRLLRITIEDAELAEETLTICMGKDTLARKKLLLEQDA